ncbi:MAG: carbohydrate ABC transporter permease [Armatimonadota bacterium]|nr:carbohydrate ABC transporter permease [Armatimonadota bacterium]
MARVVTTGPAVPDRRSWLTAEDVAALARRARRRETAGRTAVYTALALLSLPIIVPYLWLIAASFSRRVSYGLLPSGFTLDNWRFLWVANLGFVSGTTGRLPNIWQVVWNSLVLAAGTTVIVVVVATLAGYFVSRHDFRRRAAFLKGALMLQAFPGITLLVALFILLRTLNLLNSVAGVVLVIATLHLPFALFVMKGFFDGIPWDIEMSALIDGASRLRAWYTVLLPQVRNGIGAIAMFSFLWGWTDYIFVLTFILRRSSWTMALYLNAIIGEYRFVDYGLMAAVGVFYMIPSLLFFLFTQKHLMQLTLGGTKA